MWLYTLYAKFPNIKYIRSLRAKTTENLGTHHKNRIDAAFYSCSQCRYLPNVAVQKCKVIIMFPDGVLTYCLATGVVPGPGFCQLQGDSKQ